MDGLVTVALKAVDKINEEITDQIEEGSSFTSSYLILETDGNDSVISFCGISIWSTEEDEREIIDGFCEPLEPYLRKEINRILKENLNKINL